MVWKRDGGLIRSAVSGVGTFFRVMGLAFKNGVQKLLTPSEWNYGEQFRHTVDVFPAFMRAVARNSAKQITSLLPDIGWQNRGERRWER